MNARVGFLRAVPIFRGLSDDLLETLSSQMKERVFRAGQTVFFQGDEGGSLAIILDGRLCVQTVDLNGNSFHLADRSVGEHIGELSLIDGEPRSADVISVTECRLLVLHRRDFELAVAASPDLALNIMRSLAKRLREQAMRVTHQGSLDFMGRLAFAILETADGRIVQISQQSLAHRIGVSRETVNRGLRQLANYGAIEVGRGKITILDRSFLKTRSQSS